MPRIARGLADNGVYHILNRGNAKQKVFHADGDYLAFINLMEKAKTHYSMRILAYCLMPNHFHLVVRPMHGKEVSQYMHWLMTSHVRRYHKHKGTSGHIWQGRYKSFLIQQDAHLITVLRYVERNPVRAGLVCSAKNWMWSSHRELNEQLPRLLTDPSPVRLPRDWACYVDLDWSDEDLPALRRSVNRQAPYGDSDWQQKVSVQYGLQSTLRARGRPRTK